MCIRDSLHNMLQTLTVIKNLLSQNCFFFHMHCLDELFLSESGKIEVLFFGESIGSHLDVGYIDFQKYFEDISRYDMSLEFYTLFQVLQDQPNINKNDEVKGG
eukprot:TRINITY_DN25025_c0_g1_i2.p3 TRINITY_DN25025_c0_g1~~TRINITY_DN25025_c0_g1_i2.p3  ORF type:complete len:103 (-),score=6.56 TRINITY_DN25025_c0_g1_i2:179-487(-)